MIAALLTRRGFFIYTLQVASSHSARADHENTLCHEIIHTFDSRPRTDVFIGPREEREIYKATQPEAIMEHLSVMAIRPRQVARREVLAYDGSGQAAGSLDCYGVGYAREELDAIFRGLAVNPHLPKETKRELYAQALSSFRAFVIDTMALRVAFNQRIRDVGPAVAIAEAIGGDPPALSYEALGIEAQEVTSKLAGLLGRVADDSNWLEWITEEWQDMRAALKLAPCPQAFSNIVETIERSCHAYLLTDMLEAANAAVELHPECLQSVNQEKFKARLTYLAERTDLKFKNVADAARRILDRGANGQLFSTPFYGQLKTPHEEIGDTLISPWYPQEVITLLTKTYPGRHPVLSTLDVGLISERVRDMGASDCVGLYLAIAEHSSSDVDMARAIGWLWFHARFNDLRDDHLPILRRVLDACPVDPSTLSVSASLREDYVQDRRPLKEFLDQQPSSGPDSKGS